MKNYNIYDNHYSPQKEYKKERKSARAVILDNNKIFIEKTLNPQIIMLPGGGVEGDESFDECAIRECREECGIVVEPVKKLFSITEYFFETKFYSEYILCKKVGECEKHLTQHEQSLGLANGYEDIHNTLVEVEKLRDSYPKSSEYEGMHKRESIALKNIISILGIDK